MYPYPGGFMLIWSIVLLVLGILAVIDSQVNYGQVFRSANSVLFMLLALGVLIRTKILGTKGFRERLVRKNIELESRVEELERDLALLKKQQEQQNIPA
jgi:hypothetical protein